MPETRQYGTTTLQLVQGDLTAQATDAIVNAANRSLMGGGGVDGAIHRNGGPAILEACKRIRQTAYPAGLPTGEAVLTTAGDLPARYVIHTVGPIWRGGGQREPELLAQAYRNVLALAREQGLRSVAFPSISTGAYGYDIQQAAPIALQAVASVVQESPDAFDVVRFVLFSRGDFNIYRQHLHQLPA